MKRRRTRKPTEIAVTPRAIITTDRALTTDEVRWLKFRWIMLYGNGKPNRWPPVLPPWPESPQVANPRTGDALSHTRPVV